MTGFGSRSMPKAGEFRPAIVRSLDFREHLRDPRFWIVQAMVILAAVFHVAADVYGEESWSDFSDVLVVIRFGLFIVPITYASLHFGKKGAMPTAIWAGVLGIPIMLIWHEGLERLAEAFQHGLIIAIAYIIASRVDHEVAARQEAEASAAARIHSDARFRALFDAAGEAILVFNRFGEIREINAAAANLFGLSRSDVQGVHLEQFLRHEDAEELCSIATGGDCSGGELKFVRPDGSDAWLAPICNRLSAPGEQILVQALFRDVTDQRERRNFLELFARQIVTAQEEERQRIARDLHDGPLQGIVLLCRKLDSIATCTEADRTTLSRELSGARAEAEGIAAEVRRFSRDLRPSILDDLGLEPALRWLIKDLEHRTGMRAHLIAPETVPRSTPAAELGLFRIAQEALHNVERHANAKEVIVTLATEPDRIRLTIADNGKGMDEHSTEILSAQSDKFGLIGMKERVNLLGGTFALTTSSGSGTNVSVAIPISK